MTRQFEADARNDNTRPNDRVLSRIKQLNCAGRNRTYDLQVMSLAS